MEYWITKLYLYIYKKKSLKFSLNCRYFMNVSCLPAIEMWLCTYVWLVSALLSLSAGDTMCKQYQKVSKICFLNQRGKKILKYTHSACLNVIMKSLIQRNSVFFFSQTCVFPLPKACFVLLPRNTTTRHKSP